MEDLRGRIFTEAPTFGRAVYAEPDQSNIESEIVRDDGVAIDDFEFSLTSVEMNHGMIGMAGEVNFSSGGVLPVYPVFNESLAAGSWEASGEVLIEGMGRLVLGHENNDLRSRSMSSSSAMFSEVDHMGSLQSSEVAYCTSNPRSVSQSSDQWQKSGSTGSDVPEFRRLLIRGLVIGRNRGDGKENPALFPVDEKETKEEGRFSILNLIMGRKQTEGKENLAFFRKAEKETRRDQYLGLNSSRKAATGVEKRGKSGKAKGGGPSKESDVATAHRVYYGREAAGARRRFLPYRQVLLLGFFGHGKRHSL